MLKKQVGPFEFQKTTVQPGNGRVLPNDFAKCRVLLTLGSYAGVSNENILSNSLTYNLDRDIYLTIGLGEKYFDCAIDLCLQTMVERETARCKITRISCATKNIVQRNNETVPASDCNLKHSDSPASSKIIPESAGDVTNYVDKAVAVPEEKNEDCISLNSNEKLTPSTNIEIQTENCTDSNSKNYINDLTVGDCDATGRAVSRESTAASIPLCVSSCLVVDITLVSFTSASEVHNLAAEEQLERASLLKDLGVNSFKRSDVQTAFYKFSRSLRYLLVCSCEETQAELFDAWILLRCQCYLNMAACQLQQEHFSSAKLNCSRALELDTKNVKGLFRRAQASIKLDEYENARTDLDFALTLEPNNSVVMKSLSVVQNVLRARDKKLGDAMSKLFK